jgi:ribonucleotide monophosphatase NagD (HAD superfamily)
LGKPDPAFFEAASTRLGAAAADTLMIGDDIIGDIRGAQRAGLKAALVRTGKFRADDLTLGITPEAVLDSVASVPGWWTAQ